MMTTYVTEQMRQELAGHALTPMGNAVYHMAKAPDDCAYAMDIGEFAGRLVVTGDIRLGGNGRGNGFGMVSANGYSIHWFAGHLSEAYLCEKFLDKEWQWDAAVEGIRWRIEQDTEDGEGWWLDHAPGLKAYMADPCWRHDEPDCMEYCDFLMRAGADSCDDLPGMDYPRVQAGWLCAIQQRFRELWTPEHHYGHQLDRGMKDVREGRTRPAKPAIEGIADGLGLNIGRGCTTNPGHDLRRLRVDFVSEMASAVSCFDVTCGGSFASVVEACLAAGLTATELADEFKVNTSTISRWQSGRSVPGLFVRQGVSKRLVAMLQEKVVALSALIG